MQNVLNSSRSSERFPIGTSAHRPCSGKISVLHVFRLQAAPPSPCKPSYSPGCPPASPTPFHTAFQLGDQVLLVTTWSLAKNTISTVRSRSCAVVGDVEEVLIVLEQPHLVPCRPPASCGAPPRGRSSCVSHGAVLELGHLLANQLERVELPCGDDLATLCGSRDWRGHRLRLCNGPAAPPRCIAGQGADPPGP